MVLTDGNLGDRKYDNDSLSGRFIREHIQDKYRYARYTMSPESIPVELQGELCVGGNDGDLELLKDFLEKRKPQHQE